MITWRGWGVSVFYLLLFWILAAIVAVVAISPYQPDKLKASMEIQWGLAGLFVVHALSVYLVCLYRKSHPRQIADPATGQTAAVPHQDEFMYMRMDVWPYISLIIAAGVAIATALGYQMFTD
jgi:hypothetical protein